MEIKDYVAIPPWYIIKDDKSYYVVSSFVNMTKADGFMERRGTCTVLFNKETKTVEIYKRDMNRITLMSELNGRYNDELIYVDLIQV